MFEVIGVEGKRRLACYIRHNVSAQRLLPLYLGALSSSSYSIDLLYLLHECMCIHAVISIAHSQLVLYVFITQLLQSLSHSL